MILRWKLKKYLPFWVKQYSHMDFDREVVMALLLYTKLYPVGLGFEFEIDHNGRLNVYRISHLFMQRQDMYFQIFTKRGEGSG